MIAQAGRDYSPEAVGADDGGPQHCHQTPRPRDVIHPMHLTGRISTATCPSLPRAVSRFLCDHLGNRIVSSAATRPLHDRSVQDVASVADKHLLPVVKFERAQLGRYLRDIEPVFQTAEGVVFIGFAQER